MKFAKWQVLAVAALLAGINGCGSSATPTTVTMSPQNSTVVLAGTQQFSATVSGNNNTAITWDVCNAAPPTIATGTSTVSNITMPSGCVSGGNSALGTVSVNGLFTAPAQLPASPNSSIVSVVAVSQANTSIFAIVNVNLDSGIRVSISPATANIGTGEQFQLTASVTGSANTGVTWSVNQVAGGNPTNGTIVPGACTVSMPITPTPPNPTNPPGTSTACYTAPAGAQVSAAVAATSVADTNQTGHATVNVQTGNDPAFNTAKPLVPNSGVEGLLQLDVELLGSNFLSTSQVLVNKIPVPTAFVDGSTLRATLPSSFFTGPAPAALAFTVQRQNGDTSQAQNFSIVPTRPAVVSSSPASFPVNSPNGTLTVNGGYFSSSTKAFSQGQALPTTLVNSRQLKIGLSSPAFPFATPGLYPVLIQNADLPAGSPSVASTNAVVSPNPTSIPTAPTATVAVGTAPVAIGVDSGIGTGVVVDQGSGDVKLLNLDASPPSVTATVGVGKTPTSVGVDDLLHLAAVVNSADNTLSVINLQNQAATTVPLPSNPTGTTPGPSPFSVGVNPLTHRAVVAYSNTNIAAIFDLSSNPPSLVCVLGGSNPNAPNNCAATPNANTPPISTGAAPSVAVDPQLNWAVVSPGGAGSFTIIDLGAPATASQVAQPPSVIASLALTGGTAPQQGLAIDTETHQAVLTDPTRPTVTLFSLLDQTISTVSVTNGETATAVNPLIDTAVVVGSVSGSASVINLDTKQVIVSNISVGSQPGGVAIDAATNTALVTETGNNSVAVLSLGPIASPQILELSPGIAFASSSGSLTLTLNGSGFSSGATVRLDGTAVPTTVSADGRSATATVSGSLLASPRSFSVDVMNSAGAVSNEENFLLLGSVPVGLNPIGVAIDSTLDEAFVTAQGQLNQAGACTGPGNVSVVNMSTATVTNTFSAGTCPEGIAVLPRVGQAVVANNGSGDATVYDYVNKTTLSTVSIGSTAAPMGVAIDPDATTALIADSGTNNVTLFRIGSSIGGAQQIPVDQHPIAVSVDPLDGVAAVTSTANVQSTIFGQSIGGLVDIISLGGSFTSSNRVSGLQIPTDATFDPLSDTFLVADSAQNQIVVVDPKALTSTPLRVGINPTALAYNLQTGEILTVNNASKSLSAVNFEAQNQTSSLNLIIAKVSGIIPNGGSAEFSIAINPLTNVAAVVDQANGRLLLIPLPR